MKRRFWLSALAGTLFLVSSTPNGIAAPKSATNCEIGQVGPGGGRIFYKASTKQKWGQCLEAAPLGWAGGRQDPKLPWCNVFDIYFTAAIASHSYIGVTVGKGAANTNLLMIKGCSSGAGVAAHSYQGGGKKDWFLPSKNELHAMYLNRAVIGGFGDGVYWSSSENDPNGAWVHYFKTNNQYLRYKGIPNSVRPIRAF
ncbi:MAG TPA: hypothetical protein VMV42_00060 [archaeon]|nr:hypothetical protein [archaeon]